MSRIQDPIVPTQWNFQGDSNFVWTDLGKEVVYVDDDVLGAEHTTGAGGKINEELEDLYNRVGFVKRLADNSGNRGYSKHVVVNGSKQLNANDVGLITILTDQIGNPQPDSVVLTLPTRQSLVSNGFSFLNSVTSAPFMNPQQTGISPFVISGYTSSSGVPLKIIVDKTTSPISPVSGDDMAQVINIGNVSATEVYLYANESAEFVPFIFKDVASGLWITYWNVFIHNSGYANLGKYEHGPIGLLQYGQKLCDGAILDRNKFPRLWQQLDSGILSSALVAQGSKTNDKYGDGDGSTTFTLPNLSALGSSLVDWSVRY